MSLIKNVKNKKYQNTLRRRLEYLDREKVVREIGYGGHFRPMYELSGAGIIEIVEVEEIEEIAEIKEIKENVDMPIEDIQPLSKEEIKELGLTGLYNDFRSLISNTEAIAENKE